MSCNCQAVGGLYDSLHILMDDDDDMQCHIMDCIGALLHSQSKRRTETSTNYSAAKRRVFWNAILEIASIALDISPENSVINSDAQNPFRFALEMFPQSNRDYNRRDWHPLHFASVCGATTSADIQIIGSEISRNNGKSINITDSEERKRTAIHVASAVCDTNMEVIKQLMMFSPRLSRLPDKKGMLPLHYAAKYSNNIDLILKLLQSYPNGTVQQTTDTLETPLHLVCYNSNTNAPLIFEILIKANPLAARMHDKIGNIPLHSACMFINWRSEEKQIMIITALLSAYSDGIHTLNHKGTIPLYRAASFGMHLNVIKLLAKVSDHKLKKAFFWAAKGQQIEILDYLHSLCPAASTSIGDDGSTALHTCIFSSRSDLSMLHAVYKLNPAAIRCVDNYGRLPLHLLLLRITQFNPISDYADKFRFLLKNYPDAANIPDTSQCTPITLCVTNNIYAKRLLLRAVPTADPHTLTRLNYHERRMALFIFFAAMWRDGKSNIFTSLSDCAESLSLIRRIIEFL